MNKNLNKICMKLNIYKILHTDFMLRNIFEPDFMLRNIFDDKNIFEFLNNLLLLIFMIVSIAIAISVITIIAVLL